MRISRQVALLVALFVATAPVSAANPYRSKQHIAKLPADVGMDASRLHDTRQGYCGVFDPANPTTSRGLNETVFHDCLVIEVDDGFAFFSYDSKARKWKTDRVLESGNGAGARLVDNGKKNAQRQLQFVLPNETILVFSYFGDNKRPLETIKRIEQLGFKQIEGVSFVAEKVEDPPITITIRR